MAFDRTTGAEKSAKEILKRVDQLVKSNNLEKALQEVKKARELDSKNLYAFAYEERIRELYNQKQQREVLSKTIPQSELKDKPEVVDKKLKPYNVEERILKDKSTENNVPALYEEFKKVGLRENDAIAKGKASKEALEIFKQALLLAWSDGQKTSEEINDLHYLRESLSISEDEYATLDRQAKLECYILMLKHLNKSNIPQNEVKAHLDDLRKSFDVSIMDNIVIERNLNKISAKNKILIVDDDIQVLKITKEILKISAYDVVDFNTSDDALEYLKNNKVDCILCDISLDTSSMNGFIFYDKVRELNHLQYVPFIFITGLNDIVLIRTGKEMGVDDFLIKPIRSENLLVTVRGRLKRYEQMKILSGIK